MAKKKSKTLNITLITVSILILFVLVMFFINVTGTSSETSYFYDKDLGVVEIKSSVSIGLAKFFRLFQQAVTFTDTSVELGESVRFSDSYTVTNIRVLDPLSSTETDCFLGSYSIEIFNEDTYENVIIPETTLSQPLLNSEISTITGLSFTPIEAGEYLAITSYFGAECDTGTRSNCMSSLDCGGLIDKDDSTNSVIVIDPTDPCPDDEGWNEWINDEPTDNGNYEKREYHVWQVDCINTIIEETEYRTVCDDGFVIDGTTNEIGSGKKTCVVSQGDACLTDIECTSPKKCSPSSSICTNHPECNEAMNITCEDNSTIITKTCIDGWLTDSGNTCDESNQTNIIWVLDWDNGAETCLKIDKSITKGYDNVIGYLTEELCKKDLNKPPTEQIDFLPWILGFGVLILISTFGIIFFRLRRKK